MQVARYRCSHYCSKMGTMVAWVTKSWNGMTKIPQGRGVSKKILHEAPSPFSFCSPDMHSDADLAGCTNTAKCRSSTYALSLIVTSLGNGIRSMRITRPHARGATHLPGGSTFITDVPISPALALFTAACGAARGPVFVVMHLKAFSYNHTCHSYFLRVSAWVAKSWNFSAMWPSPFSRHVSLR